MKFGEYEGAVIAVSGLAVVMIFIVVAALFPDWTASAEHLATIAGLLLGGGWAVYQFWLKRADETGLSIALVATTLPANGKPLARVVSMTVTLKNTGYRRIVAHTMMTEEIRKAFEDSVLFAGDLQIRKILSGPAPAQVDWWDRHSTTLGVPLFGPINLLAEYTDADWNNDFFMEPGEEYSLGACLILQPGAYVAKFVFVGERPEVDFWSRTQAFSVPD